MSSHLINHPKFEAALLSVADYLLGHNTTEPEVDLQTIRTFFKERTPRYFLNHRFLSPHHVRGIERSLRESRITLTEGEIASLRQLKKLLGPST